MLPFTMIPEGLALSAIITVCPTISSSERILEKTLQSGIMGRKPSHHYNKLLFTIHLLFIVLYRFKIENNMDQGESISSQNLLK